jgi:hypothetical protein
MYVIKRDDEGVFFLCTACNHMERVRNFDGSLGSQRTQAAQAMNQHLRDHQEARIITRPMAMAMER